MSVVEEPPVAPPEEPRKAPSAKRRRPPVSWLLIGVALVLLGTGSILVSTAFEEEPEVRFLGPNLAVNEGAANPLDLRANNSPELVQSPVDAANLVVANRVDSPEYSCVLNVSFDGGGRWVQTPIPAPTERGSGTRCYAPDVAFGADGTLFMTYVTLKGRANSPEALWITRSRDGGKTLTEPLRVPVDRHPFQVRLTADPEVRDRLYVTWLHAEELGLYQFAETGNPIQVMRSDDGGVNWTDPVRVSSASRERVVAPAPAAGARDGELLVLYLDLKDDSLDYAGGHRGQGGPPYDGTWELVLARSTDRGGSWEESVVDSGIAPTERFIVFTPPFPSLAVDRSDGTVFAAFHDGRAGDADVYLWKLAPGAAGWTRAKRVNDTPADDGTAQYLPRVDAAPNGRLDVLYYDRRSDRTNVLNEVSMQSSFDRGGTFTPRIGMSDRAFSSRIGFGLEREMADMGSRLGLLSSDTRAFAVWTDTRAGSVRDAKQDIGRGIAAFSDPARLSDAATWLLRIAGVALILLGLAVALMLGRRSRSAA